METDAVVTEAALAVLVPHFYAKVRADSELGPIFNDAISEWDEHLEKLTAFWSSVMLGTGRYHGQPMVAHAKHIAVLTPALFDRWLELWGEAAEEIMPAAAAALRDKAGRIAESLQLGLFYRPSRRAFNPPPRAPG